MDNIIACANSGTTGRYCHHERQVNHTSAANNRMEGIIEKPAQLHNQDQTT